VSGTAGIPAVHDQEEVNTVLSYYVSVRKSHQFGLLAGPFATHDEALTWVEPAREVAIRFDEWAWFYVFGTCSTSATSRPGRLNTQLGLPSPPGGN